MPVLWSHNNLLSGDAAIRPADAVAAEPAAEVAAAAPAAEVVAALPADSGMDLDGEARPDPITAPADDDDLSKQTTLELSPGVMSDLAVGDSMPKQQNMLCFIVHFTFIDLFLSYYIYNLFRPGRLLKM